MYEVPVQRGIYDHSLFTTIINNHVKHVISARISRRFAVRTSHQKKRGAWIAGVWLQDSSWPDRFHAVLTTHLFLRYQNQMHKHGTAFYAFIFMLITTLHAWISSNTELPSMRVSATYNTPEKMLETTWFCPLHKSKVLKLITHTHTPKHSSLYCLVKVHSWENEAFPKRVSSKDMVVVRDFCHCYCQGAESSSPADLW